MKNIFLHKIFVSIFIAALFFTVGCKRTEIPATPDLTPTNPIGGVVNDAAQVNASVSGIVLDETNAPIANAVVTSGAATTTTNANGMFIFQNISLSKENGNVTVVKAGYFKGIRSFKTTEGKNHTVRIQLMQRVSSGTVNAAVGGTITSSGGATIVFPANAFVTSAGAAYTGVVSVYSRWIDPTAANLPFVIPGDLRGVSTTGVENILETYGMVGAELADASGNVLKLATGKKATVSFPIPASLSATAPTSIVL
jgi:Carboxypeptidase regulatory-like domain